MDGRIFQLQEQLIKKLGHRWTVEEMAEIVELSKPHFQRLFKNKVGVSPIAWLRERRLEKACELLESEFLNIQQIGITIGMSDDSHFTRDFKRKYGVTPSEYRKQYWEQVQD